MQNKDFMRRAIELSIENVKQLRGGPFSSVIVKQGKIIAEGTNLVTSQNDPTAHAEIVAIRQACQKLQHFHLSDCELYSSCEPCPMCLAAMYWAHIPKVYFAGSKEDVAKIGFNDAWLYQELSQPMSKRRLNMTMLLRDEARAAYVLWEKSEKKVMY